MPTFDITIDVYILLLMMLAAALVGFLGRSRQLAKKNRRIAELEREMMQAHAEVLSTQRDYCELESKVKDDTSPVIAMTKNKNEEPPPKTTERQDRGGKNRATGTD
jgi:rubrerythrin